MKEDLGVIVLLFAVCTNLYLPSSDSELVGVCVSSQWFEVWFIPHLSIVYMNLMTRSLLSR